MCDLINAKLYQTALEQLTTLMDAFSLVPPPPPPPPPPANIGADEYSKMIAEWVAGDLGSALQGACDG